MNFKKHITFLVILLISFLSSPAFAKAKKQKFAIPENVLTYMSNIPESQQKYSINAVKGKKDPGKVIYSAFQTKQQVILVWIAAEIVPNKKTCIVRSGNFYTKTPESYDRKIYEEVKNDFDTIGLEACYDKYFINFVPDAIKISLDENETSFDDELDNPQNENSSHFTGEAVLEPSEQEDKPRTKSETEETITIPALITTEPTNQISNTNIEIPEVTIKQVSPLPDYEETSFELPIGKSNGTSISRYQKEYLQDYTPVKTIKLPEDTNLQDSTITNPNEKDEFGRTLLMKAAQNGNNWEINSLISAGANLNEADNDGWTALMYGVRYQQNTQIIETLINAGAQIKVKNKYELSPLNLAASYNGNPEIIRKLLTYYSASEKEVLQSFVLLLTDNSTSEYAKIAKINAFLEKSISLNSFYQGKTPLMYAAEFSNSTAIISKLLSAGALTTIRSTEGKTAFDYASDNQLLPHDNIYWELNKK